MRIAVIGAGVSGLVAAYLLQPHHEIVVFEANDYAGGHTNTIDVDVAGRRYAVDTGFIVFNEKNYPNFVKLLRKLGVVWQPTNMSFSFRDEAEKMEYGFASLAGLYADWRNLTRPAFYRLLLDLWRFRRQTPALLLDQDYQLSLGAYLARQRYSRAFVDKFLLPFGAAIWSTDPQRLEKFPARAFVQFFQNHGLLNVRDKPRWQVIRGGSRRYVDRLMAALQDRILLNRPISSLRRTAHHVEIIPQGAEARRFDAAILAVHSNQALGILADPSPRETEILGAIPYQENLTVLHTDPSLLPRRRAVWASWNYSLPRQASRPVALTYHMNRLQSLDAPVEFCVTLNRPGDIDPAQLIRRLTYHHPVFTGTGFAAQKRWPEINGVNRTYYCGAYWGYGFHEDGVTSALRVARLLGADL